MSAHHFPDAPPNAIAHYSIAERLFDADPEARFRQFVAAEEDREVGTRAAFSSSINGVEVSAAQKPGLARKF
jgi:hypothetical protein